MGLADANLDGRDAPWAATTPANWSCSSRASGGTTLTLDMVARLDTTAARQVLSFRLPRPPAAKLRLTAPGDVEIKEGADVVSRVVGQVANLSHSATVTRFELLPQRGDTTLVMTLNSHFQRHGRLVMARSVLVDELTAAYEKLHATVSLEILHRAADQFRFVVPEGFEITEVASPLLAYWDVRQEGGRRLLGVKLREQTTDTVVLQIAAIRAPGGWKAGTAPRLEPLDVVGSVTVLGLLVEGRLNAESFQTEGLIPVDVSVLGKAWGSAPQFRPVAAWYAPQGNYALTAHYNKPPAEMAVTTNLLLILADKGQELLGGLALMPQVEKRFSFDLSVPAGWQVTSVTAGDGRPLPFDRYSPLPKGEGTGATSRVRVTVPGGMNVDEAYQVRFRAVRTPPGWLADWESQTVEFPAFAVLGAARDEGAVAVETRDDLTVRPEWIEQLTPLVVGQVANLPSKSDAGQVGNLSYNSGTGPVSSVPHLAYRYDGPKHAASFVVQRTRPRLTARTFSFFRVDTDALACHYELNYTVAEARVRRLSLFLPKDTPASISITALDGVKLKEFTSETIGGRRRWNVSLAEAQRDRVRLAVDFQQPLPGTGPFFGGKTRATRQTSAENMDLSPSVPLPLVTAEGVAYQSGLVAIEGCAELDVRVDTSARPVDVGELADAEYQPGRRLLGAYGFVGDPAAVTLDVLRHPGYDICAAIVQRCDLDTNLSPDGQSQTQARFKLRTKAVFLQVKLPEGAELWSAELNGSPLKPQREGRSVLVDVPASTADATQDLQIVYAAPVAAVELRGTVAVPAPRLLLRAEHGTNAVEVPLADLVWRLHLPSGYEVVRAGGTLASDEVRPPRPAALQLAVRSTIGTTGSPAGGCCRPATVRRGSTRRRQRITGLPKVPRRLPRTNGRRTAWPSWNVLLPRKPRNCAPVEPN